MKRTLFFWLFYLAVKVKCVDWGYDPDNGPSTWGGMCKSGTHQSPINIQTSSVEVDSNINEIGFTNYEIYGLLNVKNYENSVKIHGFDKWGTNQPFISGGILNGNYLLQQIHFHWSENNFNGSEHTIDGQHYQAEVHFVHQKNGTQGILPYDGLAVIGVFLSIGNYGTEFAFIEEALKQIVEPETNTSMKEFSPKQLLPDDRNNFYTYNGSLTTPPCNQTVIWTIMADSVSITVEQLNLLRKIKSSRGKPYAYNFRPVQPLNDRRIKYRSLLSNYYTVGIIMVLIALSALLAVLLVRYILAKRATEQRARNTNAEYDPLLGDTDQ